MKALGEGRVVGGLRFWRRLSLLQQFSAIGLSLTCIIAIVLGVLLGQQFEQAALDQAAQVTVDSVRRSLDPAIGAADFATALTPERYAQVDDIVRQRLLPTDAVRVRIWSADSTVLYSNDGVGVGERHGGDRGLQRLV